MKISRMTKGTWGLNTAFFDLEVAEGVIIKGFRLIEKDGSKFVGVPSKKKEKEDGYDNIVYFEKEQYHQLNKLAIEHYEESE